MVVEDLSKKILKKSPLLLTWEPKKSIIKYSCHHCGVQNIQKWIQLQNVICESCGSEHITSWDYAHYGYNYIFCFVTGLVDKRNSVDFINGED